MVRNFFFVENSPKCIVSFPPLFPTPRSPQDPWHPTLPCSLSPPPQYSLESCTTLLLGFLTGKEPLPAVSPTQFSFVYLDFFFSSFPWPSRHVLRQDECLAKSCFLAAPHTFRTNTIFFFLSSLFFVFSFVSLVFLSYSVLTRPTV